MANLHLFSIAAFVLYTSALFQVYGAPVDPSEIVPEGDESLETSLIEPETPKGCYMPAERKGRWHYLSGVGPSPPNWGYLMYTTDCKMRIKVSFPLQPEGNFHYQGRVVQYHQDPNCYYHVVTHTNSSNFPLNAPLARCAYITTKGKTTYLNLTEWYKSVHPNEDFSNPQASSLWYKPEYNDAFDVTYAEAKTSVDAFEANAKV